MIEKVIPKCPVSTIEHACLGISPFNSYFSSDVIGRLIHYVCSEFKEVSIFIPDEFSVHTLLAAGYDKSKAEKKAKRQANYLRNKVLPFLTGMDSIQIIDSVNLIQNEFYQKELERVCLSYTSDAGFKRDCLETSRKILLNYMPENQINHVNLEKAVKYLLAEFPLFISSPKILGKVNSIFLYHKEMDVLQNLYHKIYSIKPEPTQYFGLLQTLD